MGHEVEENEKLTGTAQITLQVCLQRAIFSARFRGMMLESEDMAYRTDKPLSPEGIAAAPRRDLVLRAAIIRNVVTILKNRLSLLDADILQTGKNDLEKVAVNSFRKRYKVAYIHPTYLQPQEARVWAKTAKEALEGFHALIETCAIDAVGITVVSVGEDHV